MYSAHFNAKKFRHVKIEENIAEIEKFGKVTKLITFSLKLIVK